MIARQTFVDTTDSVPEARNFATGVLAELPRPAVESVVLMISELATNAVQHASSAFEVMIDFDAARVLVEVSDNGAGRVTPRRHGPRDPSGRGLEIVRMLSDDWGVLPANEEWLKSVWFAVRLTEMSSAPPEAAATRSLSGPTRRSG